MFAHVKCTWRTNQHDDVDSSRLDYRNFLLAGTPNANVAKLQCFQNTLAGVIMGRPLWPDPYRERPAAPAEPAARAQSPVRSARAHTTFSTTLSCISRLSFRCCVRTVHWFVI